MKFRISSALKDHIGKELITNDNVAILELVKNSYDAEAKKVEIVFEDMRSDKRKIHIIDDGKGMSKKDIEGKWLFVGYSEKKKLKEATKSKGKKERVMAGEKGIGRFSCDKLGKKLRIITKTKKDSKFNVLELNWVDFEENQEQEFQSIPVKIYSTMMLERGFNIIKDSGTVIEISQLREKEWNREKVLSLKRYLQRLINPLQVSDSTNFQISLKAEDFIVKDHQEKYDYNKVNGLIINNVYETLGLKTTTIDCEISADGRSIKTSLNDKGIKIFELEEKNDFNLLNSIKVKISYLNKTAKTTFSKLMGVAPVRYGNIFVFKNGFRILPLGDPKNDWLGLDIRKGQKHYGVFGTRELLGRVEIRGHQENLKEVASREGLMHTPAYDQLTTFLMEKSLLRLEKYVVGAIDWDSPRGGNKKDFDSIKKDSLKVIEKIAGSLDNKALWYNKNILTIVEKRAIQNVPLIIKNLGDLIKKEKDKEIRDFYSLHLKNLKQGLKLQKEEYKKKISVKEQETGFWRSVTSKEFEEIINYLHDIGLYSNTIDRHLKNLKDIIKRGENISGNKIKDFVEAISIPNKNILSLSRYVTKPNIVISSEEGNNDLISFIKNYIREVSPIFKAKIKEIIISGDVDSEFKMRFRPIQIMTIIDNLISNSKKANATKMNFDLELISIKEILITIADNGEGLNKKVREDPSLIFNKGVSTTRGSGLGLYSVLKTVEELGGEMTLDPKFEKGILFQIRFKK